jgi:curved DNA-binding protein CbpA
MYHVEQMLIYAAEMLPAVRTHCGAELANVLIEIGGSSRSDSVQDPDGLHLQVDSQQSFSKLRKLPQTHGRKIECYTSKPSLPVATPTCFGVVLRVSVMIANRPAVLAFASNALQYHAPGVPTSTTSLLRITRQQACAKDQSHRYATIAGDVHEQDRGQENADFKHVWPSPGKGHSCPTPYQILDHKQDQLYTKARYYQLVKIYHPDTGRCTTKDASYGVRLERYRLVVAAHTILSDPAKRDAYDKFGAGWSGKSAMNEQHNWARTAPYPPPGPFNQNGHNSDPIWQNATWEDWERWHNKRSGQERPEPVLMKNGYFVTCVVVLAAFGGTMNYSRAQDAGTYYIEQRDLVHDRASKELRRVRQDKSTVNSRQDRINLFVRQRAATMGLAPINVEAMREDQAARILPKDVCRSEGVREGD